MYYFEVLKVKSFFQKNVTLYLVDPIRPIYQHLGEYITSVLDKGNMKHLGYCQ